MQKNRKPNFENLLKVLKCEKPSRPTLFEFFLNGPLYEKLAGRAVDYSSPIGYLKSMVEAFAAAGYDYTTINASGISFPTAEKKHSNTITLNDGAMITDRASFEAYPWPNPDVQDYSMLKEIEQYLPEGMKLMVFGPNGVLENVIGIVGFDNLCYMLFEDPDLVQDIFDKVGSILLRYYEKAVQYDSVGLVMSNDDWGFNSQTFLSLDDMRKYVFPWHKKIVQAAHNAGKPAVLHSCGYMIDVMDDIIEDMHYDGKHSYEDNILCVEDSYARWGGRIAILGGIDVDFLIRSSVADIEARCKNMLALTAEKGGYALGSGNSIPDYIPDEKYFAMIHTAVDAI